MPRAQRYIRPILCFALLGYVLEVFALLWGEGRLWACSCHDLFFGSFWSLNCLPFWGGGRAGAIVGGLVRARFFIHCDWDLDLGACALVRVTLALEPTWGSVGFEPSRWRL